MKMLYNVSWPLTHPPLPHTSGPKHTMFRDMTGSLSLGAGIIGAGAKALPTAIVGQFPGNRSYPYDQV